MIEAIVGGSEAFVTSCKGNVSEGSVESSSRPTLRWKIPDAGCKSPLMDALVVQCFWKEIEALIALRQYLTLVALKPQESDLDGILIMVLQHSANPFELDLHKVEWHCMLALQRFVQSTYSPLVEKCPFVHENPHDT